MTPRDHGSLAQLLDPAALLAHAPDAMLVVDGDGAVVLANRQAEALFGHPLEDLLGRPVEVLLPPELRAAHERHRGSYAAGPSVRPMGAGLDLCALRADGTVFPVEISLSPVDAGGQRLTLASVRDVTAQRAAEQELRHSEEQFRQTFESSPVGIAVMRLDGSWTSVNPAMCALTGHSREDLLGRSLPEIVPDPVDLVATGDTPTERRLQRADGTSAWVEITVAVVRDAHGNDSHLVGHFYDVTERRSRQHELQALALSDPLTGLPNRTLLLDRTSQALAALARHPGRCALLVLDLDHFKAVNDTLGHQAGDELLRQVAARLAAVARSSDTVARLGGDEFAVLCTQLGPSDDPLPHRLLESLEEDIVLALEDGTEHATRIGASIGVAYCDQPGAEASDLYRDADLALYAAKARGRGRVEVFDDELQAEAERRRSVPDQRGAR